MVDQLPHELSSSEFIPSSKDLHRITDLIAGDETDFDTTRWIQDNITSIRQATGNGKHKTLYYPASGADILRPLYAYDVSHLITIDPETYYENLLEKQLQQLNIPFSSSRPNSTTKQVVFELEGKSRTITQSTEDARLVSPADFSLPQVDILHLYFPTGADTSIKSDEIYLREKYGKKWFEKRYDTDAQEQMRNDPNAPKVEEATGQYPTAIEGIETRFGQKNYQMVQEGGYFVFNEERISPYDFPQSLLQITGLSERKITGRHPFRVTTSFYPSKEQLKTRDRTGYIYKKERQVSSDVVAVMREALDHSFWRGYAFAEFERGEFVYLGFDPDKQLEVTTTITNDYKEHMKQVQEYAARFRNLAISEDLVKEYVQQSEELYTEWVSTTQRKLNEFLGKYQEVSEAYLQDKITSEQAQEELGIVQSGEQYIPYKNTKWPLAAQLTSGSHESTQYVYDIIEQFAAADLSNLTSLSAK